MNHGDVLLQYLLVFFWFFHCFTHGVLIFVYRYTILCDSDRLQIFLPVIFRREGLLRIAPYLYTLGKGGVPSQTDVSLSFPYLFSLLEASPHIYTPYAYIHTPKE